MKKLVLFLLTVVMTFSVFAALTPIVGFNPLARFSTFPTGSIITTKQKVHQLGPLSVENWYERPQDIYYRYYDQVGLIDLGLKLDDEHFDFVVDIDVRQTFQSYVKNKTYSNIPFVGNTVNAIADFNFPRIAYGEITFDKFYVSIGRRPIGWGPSEHDMAISSDVPFMDNIWVEYKTPTWGGNFGYNFVAISCNSEVLATIEDESREPEKTLLAHKFSWTSDSFRVSLGELNLIYGAKPNLIDISPFGVYHNLFQDNKSNVMLSLSAEYLADFKDAGKLRAYASVAMDDFDLPNEVGNGKNNGKPGAMGFTAGIQYHFFDTEKTETFTNNLSKYALKEDTFEFSDGLNLAYSFYFCTPYMYNRNCEHGKFTVPSKMYGSPTTQDENAMYFGFKYGPNSMLNEISVSYSEKTIAASLKAGFLLRGDYSINSPYGVDAVENGDVSYDYRFKLFGNVDKTILLNAEAKWLYRKNMELFTQVDGAIHINSKKFAITATLGTSINLF